MAALDEPPTASYSLCHWNYPRDHLWFVFNAVQLLSGSVDSGTVGRRSLFTLDWEGKLMSKEISLVGQRLTMMDGH